MYGTISVLIDIRLCQPGEIQEIPANVPQATGTPGAWSPNNARRWSGSSPDHPALPFALQPGADPEHPRQFPLTQGLPA